MQSKHTLIRYLNVPPLDQLLFVLKECNYGCVVCGSPICYIHPLNDAAGLGERFILLCQKHSDHKYKSVVSDGRSIRDGLNFNKAADSGEDILYYGNGSIKPIMIGMFSMHIEILPSKPAYTIEQVIMPIVIDSLPVFLITLIDAHLLFDIILLDEFNNELLVVRKNIIHYCKEGIDINFNNSILLVTTQNGKILLNIEFSTDSIKLVEGYFLISGVKLEIDRNHIIINGKTVSITSGGANSKFLPVGISIGQNNMPTSFINVEQINRYH